MRTLICTILLLLAGLESALAAKVTLQARRHAVVQGDRIVLEATIDAEGTLKELRVPEGATAARGGSQSQVNITNGRMKRSETTTFQVSVTQPGAYVLGPAIAIVDGKTLQSNRVKVIVQPPGQDRVLQVRSVVKPVRVYEGEPFQLVTKVAYGSHFQPTGWTPSTHRAVQTHPGQKQAHQTQDLVPLQGQQIPELHIANWMIPIRAGTFALTGGYVELESTDRRQSRRPDPFGFFGSSRPSVQQPIPSATVQVTPLPGPPAGSSFTGLVGTFQQQWDLRDAADTKIRGILTLRGVGSALAPHLGSWTHNGWTVYPDAPEVSYDQDAAGTPYTTVQIPVILVAGATVDSLYPHWFDTAEGTYRPLELPVPPAPEPEEDIPANQSGAKGGTDTQGHTTGTEPCIVEPASNLTHEIPFDVQHSTPWPETMPWGLFLQALMLPAGFWLKRRTQIRQPANRVLLAKALKSDTPEAWQDAWQQLSTREHDPEASAIAHLIAHHIFQPEYTSPLAAVRSHLEKP